MSGNLADLIYTALELSYGSWPPKRSLGIISTQCRYSFPFYICVNIGSELSLISWCVEGVLTRISLGYLQVIGAVGFMNQRLEIPADVDPQWASIIESCWHRLL